MIGLLRRARMTWWTTWPYESAFTWVRGLFLLWGAASLGVRQNPDLPPLPIPHGARVLLLRLTHLGDIIQAVPFALDLKRQRPDVKLDILVGPWSESLARRFDCFDEVIVYSPDFVQLHRGDRGRVLGWLAELRFFRILRTRAYHALIVTSPIHLAEQTVIHAVAPVVTFGAEGGLGDFPILGEDRRRKFNSRMHEAEWVSSFLADMGLAVETASLSFPTTVVERSRAVELLEKVTSPRVVIAPGSGWSGKCWPVDRFVELASRLQSQCGAGIVLVGSGSESELTNAVCSQLSTPALNLAGQTSLGESAAVIAASDLLIGNDSAPMHIAAAVGTRTVAIFGPTFASKWAPQGDGHRVLQVAGLCEGCVCWHPLAPCLHANRCVKAISVDAVFDAATSLLKEPA